MDAKDLVQGLVEGREGEIVYREVDFSRDRATFSEYDIQSTPTVIILDASGKQVYSEVGVPGESELKAAIEEAVSSESGQSSSDGAATIGSP